MPDTVGRGAAEGDLPRQGDDALGAVARMASNGYLRGHLPKFQVISGSRPGGIGAATTAVAQAAAAVAVAGTLSMATAHALHDDAASAVAVSVTLAGAADSRLSQIREARLKGFEGDACGECGNFTLVRNGTCLKCDTCGATSGCS